MISRYTYHDVTWIDIESPTKEELVHVMEEFAVPELLTEEMLSSTLHSKVELYDHLIYMILHFPPSSQNEERSTDQEIDFVIGKGFLITVHYEQIYALSQFQKKFELARSYSHAAPMMHGGIIFVEMMKELYRHTLHKVEITAKDLQDVEFTLFKGKEETVVKTLSLISRKLLDLKRALHFHQDILRSYETASKKMFGESYSYHADIIISEFNKVHALLESARDTIADLQKTNDSLLSTKSNDIMRTFTIMTFVMMPLTLITGIFGMNTVNNIIFIQSKADFFFVVGAMILTGLVMFLFFKVRKWL